MEKWRDVGCGPGVAVQASSRVLNILKFIEDFEPGCYASMNESFCSCR